MPKKNAYKDLDQILGSLRKQADGAEVDQSTIVNKAGDPDDQTTAATEGARSSENTTDVKATVGENSVDSSATAPEVGATQTNPLNDLGTQARPTGEAPEVENVDKDKKDDPGTAKTELEVGTASDPKFASMSIDALENDILTDLTVAIKTAAANTKVAEVTPAKSEPEKENKVLGDEDKQAKIAAVIEDLLKNHADDVKAGYEAASQAANTVVKTAADQISEEDVKILENIVKEAQVDATMTAQVLDSYISGLLKNAGIDPAMLEAAAPAAAETGEQGMPEVDPAMLEAALAQGGEQPMAPAEGEVPQEDEAIIEEIANALEAEGVTPEELAAAIAAEQGGETAGAPELEAAPVMDQAKEAQLKSHKEMVAQLNKVFKAKN